MAKHRRPSANILNIRRQLLEWYAANQRDLPWRRSLDPYAIWVSEIMLQQTRVAVVIERYLAFMARFPHVQSLALAEEQDVLGLWSGLGYYRRARMLHKGAQFVVSELDGRMPAGSKQLRDLPGVGPYTAAAIASIAHGEVVAVVDGNVERVLSRLEGWDHESHGGGAALKARIGALAQELVDPVSPGDFNQALMELGATVCLPRNPQCLVCRLAAHCVTRGEHKTAPRAVMRACEVACALVLRSNRSGQQVLLEQRATAQTVMPGLWELPVLKDSDVPEEDLCMTVRHAIMQVNYTVRVRTVAEDDVRALTVVAGVRGWAPLNQLHGMALTGLARKVLRRAHLLEPVAPHSRGNVV